MIKCTSEFFRDCNICRVVDVNSLDLLGCDSFSWLWRWFLARLLIAIKGKFFLWNRASAIARDMTGWTNLFGHAFKRSNNVTLKIHCAFCWIVQVAFIICFVKKFASLMEVANKRFAFSIMVEVDGYIS